MKKILGLLVFSIAITACNDGDLVFDNFNFDEKDIQKCEDNELYFKINNNQLLLVDFTFGNNLSVLDSLAPLNEMQKILTSDRTKIYYRTYDAAVSKNVICALLAPANPKVTSEYISIPGGTINYTRTMRPIVTETAVNVSYVYTINFENITLTNGTSDIRYAVLPYGSYQYDNSRMSFNFTTNFTNCDNVLIGYTATEVVQLTLPENFVFPTANQTQNIPLNNTTDIQYFVFKNSFSIDEDAPCEFPTETIKEQWQSTSGNLQIESSAITNASGNVTGYRHQLKLQQTQFNNDLASFVITERILGTYNTQI